MHRQEFPLLSPSIGSQKTLVAFCYGPEHAERKVYIQASLHAEELPGMLVAHHLKTLLAQAHTDGRLQARVVLVPVANPMGLAQRAYHHAQGRFELDTAENFNRHYPDLAAAVYPMVRDQLGQDPQHNAALIRQATAQWLGQWAPATELQSLRKTLLCLAHDADWVLDLHCDCQSVMHLYCEEPCWPAFEPLAARLGCQAVLLAQDSGGGPFDERLSGQWWQLQAMAQRDGIACAIAQGCASTTVELRGEADVSHPWAAQDARAIVDYLADIGALRADPLAHSALPPAACRPTPLAGSQTLLSPVPGVLVFVRELGETIAAGDVVAEVIDPTADTSRVHAVRADVSGVFYARVNERYVHAGGEVGKIAGPQPFRTGPLLGA
jgi:predicted deacylase